MTDMDAQALEELSEALDERIRRIAREEIASLSGLVVRRTQDMTIVDPEALARIFGEALNDFTTPAEPGS